MEAGVMGVGGVQYRNLLHVSREIPPDVKPRLSTSRSMSFAPFSEPSRNIQHSVPPYSPHEQNDYTAHVNRPFRENPFQEPPPPPPHSRSQSFSTVQSSSRTGIIHPPPARYDMPSGSETRHRTRQAISCFPCRQKKLRCDGAKPCVQCVRRNSIEKCAYADGVRRRGKGRRAEDGEGGSSDSGSGGGERDKTEVMDMAEDKLVVLEDSSSVKEEVARG
ncbi:hypothetical protein BCR39DRAFT_545514 [Naematelia encephala]|uniref:Zn(2)-C6 fungal-type domain-containing protein n=1 Tax=Naematelia encephala TaxID=71784 RepID=A0A1Y2AR10_9TREE|nr:hypothetical protein BCR39DRAFT_545514 [Naematelia encephala]